MIRILVLTLTAIVFGLCSCTMPNTSVRTIDDRPTLAFIGAPEGAVVFVDGLNMGVAGQYDGEPKVLIVEPGTHVVRVTLGNDVVYEQRVFVESSLKTITVR
jgi:hypothetical protein